MEVYGSQAFGLRHVRGAYSFHFARTVLLIAVTEINDCDDYARSMLYKSCVSLAVAP